MLIATFQHRHYLFAALCVRRLTALGRLQPALHYYLEHHGFPSEHHNVRISSSNRDIVFDKETLPNPRDIQRWSLCPECSTVPDELNLKYIQDLLRRTQKGRINPLLKTKAQLKKERKRFIKLKSLS